MTWNIPNILTVMRLLAAPGVAIMFLYFARPWADWFAMLLFVAAAITDWFDGYLARLWKQESAFGAMLDPIADKAMVVIALLVITAFSGVGRPDGMDPWILLPATVILFREVFVSGLREFLGDRSKALKVTKLAKYKTFAQMIALTVLFATGIFQHNFFDRIQGMDGAMVEAIMTGAEVDHIGLLWYAEAANLTWWGGTILLWIAGALTLVTGWDYFSKALPFFREGAGK